MIEDDQHRDDDRLNFFSPYERLKPGHENQLTRALLVVLRLSPMAHAVWLGRVRSELEAQAKAQAKDQDWSSLELHHLPKKVLFRTQKREVRAREPSEVEVDERIDVVSVHLAPERSLSGGGDLEETDRGQVLDAIIDFDGELVVVVENKVFEKSPDTQAWQVRGACGTKVDVEWPALLDDIYCLLERDLVAGAEGVVLDDFLTFVEDHFPRLGPLSTLERCRRDRDRLRNRLRVILGEAVGREAKKDGDTSARVAIRDAPRARDHVIAGDAILSVIADQDGSPEFIELSLYPADTLTWARKLYNNQEAMNGLRALIDRPEWEVEPNFHFGFMEQGQCFTHSMIPIGEYIDCWSRQIVYRGRQIKREEWEEYWKWLESQQIACPEDKAEFDRRFRDSKRPSADPKPGIKLYRRWTIDEAENLDDPGNELVDLVRGAIDAALSALAEDR